MGSESVTRFPTWKQASQFYGSTVRVVQGQVLYLSAGGSSNRREGAEGQKGVRKTNRAAKSGPCPKDREDQCTPRDPHSMKRVYGFRKENQLIVLQYEHL